jgi:hypothetical protein
MSKKVVVGIIALVIVAVSAIALIIVNSQLMNPQNPNVSNPYFDMQLEYDSSGLRVSIINKLDDQYLSSYWSLMITNDNKNSTRYGQIQYSSTKDNAISLEPNGTKIIHTVNRAAIEYNYIEDEQDACVVNIKLTLDNYGTVSKVFTLPDIEMYTEQLKITSVDFKNVEFPNDDTMSVTVKNVGKIPITFEEIYVYDGSHDYLTSSVTLQPNESSTQEFVIGWVSGYTYQIKVVTTKGTEAVYIVAAPS